MNKDTKKNVKKVVKTAGNVGKVGLAGLLLVGNIVATCVGAIVCAVTSQD